MELSVLYFIFIGYLVESSHAGKKDHVHIKIHVPEYIKHHHHTKYVYVKKKGGHKKHHDDHGHDDHGHDDHGHGHGKKKVQVVIHKHEHNHKHKHDHGHKHGHNHGHKHDAKHDHKHNHKGQLSHKHQVKKVKDHGHHDDHHGHSYDHEGYNDYEDHGSYSIEPYTGDYQRKLSGVRSERLQYETVQNPHGARPGRYLVKASYKVNEKDPYDFTTKGYHQNFQYPTKNPSFQDVYKYAQLVKQFKSNDDPFLPFGITTDAPALDDIKQLEDEQDYRSDNLQQYGKAQEQNSNYVDYDYNPPVESYENSNYEYDNPSEAQSRKNYRIDGTSLDEYLKNEYGSKHEASEVSEIKVPFNSTSTEIPDSSELV